ncbi:MAG: MFS transporter [Oscillospiraceae bacterium]|nr:MFS transporter [Oscillospiraceae bacterium]
MPPKETLAFVLFDVAATVNISGSNSEFVNRILNIDMGLQAAIRPITLAWDVFNDLFVASFVDRTRTRFGKFRPYMIAYPIYGIPVSMLYYILPYLFLGTDAMSLSKLATYALVGMFNDLTGTISEMVRTGMIATITPSPQERISLITKANFFSMFGEELPQQIFKIVLDVVARQTDKYTRAAITNRMRPLFSGFGVGCIALSGAFSLYFAIVARERVFGAEGATRKLPGFRETIQSLLRNRPQMMLTLAEILGAFGLRNQMSLYTDSILNFRNFGFVMGIPGSPVSYISYSYVPKLRAAFSTKALWVLTAHMDDVMRIPIFFAGLMGKNFLKLKPMLAIFCVQNTISMFFYGSRKVIPEEIRNECIDYGEWKNGFRSEGMTGALRGLPKKVTTGISDTITSAVMKMIGYNTGDDFNAQSESVAKGVFAMSTLLPSLFGLLGIIPKLIYNIDQKTRTQMYDDLRERRAAVAAEMQSGSSDRQLPDAGD